MTGPWIGSRRRQQTAKLEELELVSKALVRPGGRQHAHLGQARHGEDDFLAEHAPAEVGTVGQAEVGHCYLFWLTTNNQPRWQRSSGRLLARK